MEGQNKKRSVFLHPEFIFTAVFFICMILLMSHTMTWPEKPRALPMWILLMMIVLLAVEMVKIYLKEARRATAQAVKKAGAEATGIKALEEKHEFLKEEEYTKGVSPVIGFVILGATIVLAFIVSLPVAMGLMGAAYCLLYGERRWHIVAFMGVITAVMVYAIFGLVLQIPMML